MESRVADLSREEIMRVAIVNRRQVLEEIVAEREQVTVVAPVPEIVNRLLLVREKSVNVQLERALLRRVKSVNVQLERVLLRRVKNVNVQAAVQVKNVREGLVVNM